MYQVANLLMTKWNKVVLYTIFILLNKEVFCQDHSIDLQAQIGNPIQIITNSGEFSYNRYSYYPTNKEPVKLQKNSSFSSGVSISYMLQNYFSIRFKYSNHLVERNIFYDFGNINFFQRINTLYRQELNQFSLGTIGHLEFKKLDFLGGIEIPFIYDKGYKQNVQYFVIDTLTLDTVGQYIFNVDGPKGKMFGITFVSGIKYNILKRVSIGLENSLSCLVIKYNKDVKTTTFKSGNLANLYIFNNDLNLMPNGFFYLANQLSLFISFRLINFSNTTQIKKLQNTKQMGY